MRTQRLLLSSVTFVLCSLFATGKTLANNAVNEFTSTTDASGAQDFAVDVEAGANLQVETSGEPATALEFTTDGGVPFFNPYAYQRIGSDGE